MHKCTHKSSQVPKTYLSTFKLLFLKCCKLFMEVNILGIPTHSHEVNLGKDSRLFSHANGQISLIDK